MKSAEDLVFNNIIHRDQSGLRYINILSIIYVTFLMAATVMAYKVIDIYGVFEPGSTIIYTFTFFLGNIFAEVYGSERAKKLIWESIIAGYIFAILITFVNKLPSPNFWNLQKEFNVVLGNILRFTNAGVIGYLLSAFLNIYLLTKWKYKLSGKLFWLRSFIATSISEGLATFIAGFITFLGMMPNKDVMILMMNALIFKILYGLIAVWPATFIAYILKKKEKNIIQNASISNLVCKANPEIPSLIQ
jgi:queuosine precursor transporter